MTSIIKVDNLQNQCGANIISESANVITIGASGDTVTLAAGASQSGFGRSGSVNWDTTPKTSTPVTAVSGNGYFINTTSIAITVNLPSTPAAGDIVAIADYANTSATNNIIVGRNGSLIDGEAINGLININGQVYTLVYVDATEGWKTVGQTFNQITLPQFVAATGGTITTAPCGNFKVHTFTGPGTFTVTNAGNSAGSNSVDYLVVAGGGGTGGDKGGGGGAGGFRTNHPSPAIAGLPVTATGYPIVVGGGGPVIPNSGPYVRGSDSIFSTITSTGGGSGGVPAVPLYPGQPGGSGGGARSNVSGTGGTGNSPPTSPPQGNNGGSTGGGGINENGGGGGGAGAVGAAGGPNPSPVPSTGRGGAGSPNSISGSAVTYSGGGGGGGNAPTTCGSGSGGVGGGGAGGGTGVAGGAGTINTGGGAGGGGDGPVTGAGGGSGIVVIRYKFQ
jgi:hypothetical protein